MFIYNLNSMIIDNKQRKTMKALKDAIIERITAILELFPELKDWYEKNSKDIVTWIISDADGAYRVSFVSLVQPPEVDCLTEKVELLPKNFYITCTTEDVAPGDCLIKVINGVAHYYSYMTADETIPLPKLKRGITYMTRAEAYYTVAGYYSDLVLNIADYNRTLNGWDVDDNKLQGLIADRDAAKDVMDTIFGGASDVYIAKGKNVMPVSRYLAPAWTPTVQIDSSIAWHRSTNAYVPFLNVPKIDWINADTTNFYPPTYRGKTIVVEPSWKGDNAVYLETFKGYVCCECGNFYRISKTVKDLYTRKGLNTPTRCPKCKRAQRFVRTEPIEEL